MASQPSFENLSGNIEVELVAGRNSSEVCLHLFWELQVQHIQCVARGMLFKGKSGCVTALLRSTAVSPLIQDKAHTVTQCLPRPLSAPPVPISVLTLLCSPYSIHARLAVSGAFEKLPHFNAGCTLCQNSSPLHPHNLLLQLL